MGLTIAETMLLELAEKGGSGDDAMFWNWAVEWQGAIYEGALELGVGLPEPNMEFFNAIRKDVIAALKAKQP